MFSDRHLEFIGQHLDITRERVRQIEVNAKEKLCTRILGLYAVKHPAALALFSHTERLGDLVLAAASEEDAILIDTAKERWIRRVLPALEAEILLVLLLMADEVDPERRFLFDPLSVAGETLGGGRTALIWRDDHVDALRDGFQSVVGDRARRWASVSEVAAAAKLEIDTIGLLAKFAKLTLHSGWIFEGRLKVADVRRTMATAILAASKRPMHLSEVMEAALLQGFTSEAALRDIQRAMMEEPDIFANDGRGVWQLREQFGDDVQDKRSEHPQPPLVLTQADLLQAIATISKPGRCRPRELLLNLSPDDDRFAIEAGSRLAAALTELPATERCSIVQVLNIADAQKLKVWLQHMPASVPDPNLEVDYRWARRALEGLTALAAFAASILTKGNSDSGPWTAVVDICGEEARARFFNSQSAPRNQLLTQLVEVAHIFRLRHAFDFQSDPWAGLLTLQVGLVANDLLTIAQWLRVGRPIIAIQHMLAPGRNYSASMTCTWNVMQAYRRGEIGREAMTAIAENSEWWPGWSVDESCEACMAPRPERERPTSPTSQPRPDPMPAATVIEITGTMIPASSSETFQPAAPFASDDVTLDPSAQFFAVQLPHWLPFSPGPITLLGTGIRVGGSILEDGSVVWHRRDASIRLCTQGAGERLLRIERGADNLASYSVRLWAPDDYFKAYRLGDGHGRAIDPFVAPLPRQGPVALLLHRTLKVSAEPDDEETLDDSYTLQIFHTGVAPGSTVSCEGEILWEAQQTPEPRKVMADIHVRLELDSSSALWGAPTDLILWRPPAGFVPNRAYIGVQVLPALQDGETWKFPGFALLPGMDSLRRRGRVDGILNGERASLPAEVSLGKAPIGAALRDAECWRPLDPFGPFEVTRDAPDRLWTSLPSLAGDADWIVMEGWRPVAAYRAQGIRLGRGLLGLGEHLTVAPRRFNLDGSSIQLARAVTDSGSVISCNQTGEVVNLRLTTPLAWTDKHKALGWSRDGITELTPFSGHSNSNELHFVVPDDSIDGVCLFHGTAWLGTGMLATDPTTATAAFLAKAPSWPGPLQLGMLGHLPILADDVMAWTLARLKGDGGRGVIAMCRAPENLINNHIIGSQLERWNADPTVAEALTSQFLRTLTGGSTNVTALERIAISAPTSAVRVVAHGVQSVTARDRYNVIESLIRRVLPGDIRNDLRSSTKVRLITDAEQALLAQALDATKFDDNFLAAKSEASIASLAWASASSPTAIRHEPNLATALTIGPVRRWLTVNLLARLAALVR